MAPYVFISYSSKNTETANAVCAALEENGIPCWIAPRDIMPGTDWSEPIIDAIDQCSVMVLLYSSYVNSSSQIKHEVERADGRGLVIIPFRIEDAPLSKFFLYHLSTSQWLDAFTPPLDKHLVRLVEAVRVIRDKGEDVPVPPLRPRPLARVSWRVGLALVLALLILSSSIFLYHRPYATGGGDAIDLAVLPFKSVGSDDNVAELGVALADDLINRIAKLPQVSVISRNSVSEYKGRELSVQAVGQQLKVRAVLTGVISREPGGLVINAELIDTATNRRIWGGQYPTQDSAQINLSVRHEIAVRAAEKLRQKLTTEDRELLDKYGTQNQEAADHYLNGRAQWFERKKPAVLKSIDLFQQALGEDPDYANAYAGLADAYIVLGDYEWEKPQVAFPQAIAAARRAIGLNPTLSEAHNSLAQALLLGEWNFQEARQEFQRAATKDATAYQWYAEFLSMQGQHDEAIKNMRAAQRLDPYAVIIKRSLGDLHYNARQFDDAITQYNLALSQDSMFPLAHDGLGFTYWQKKMYDESVAEFIKELELDKNNGDKVVELREAYQSGGVEGYWKKRVEQLTAEHASSYDIAVAYVGAGDREQAIKYLTRACDEHSSWMLWTKVDPWFDGLRADARFVALQHKIAPG
ncbi:MAG: eukaryotic-like serine/threonine-protein kinase [Acidobacteriota bacterium]|nr:eukaryotic-like serine/threonine-protein kinase [Acidobacteriota bacterium]